MSPRLQPVRLTRHAAAAPDRVFTVLTDERLVPKWFGPRHIDVVDVQLDLRPGGRCRWEMRAPDGATLVLLGDYEVVDPPRRLVWTNAWEHEPELRSRIAITLVPTDRGTRIEMVHEDLPEEHAEEALPGWEDTLDRLVELVERG